MALTGKAVMGVKCKMFVKNTTYQECGIVNDTVSIGLSRDEAELKERGNLETLVDVGHKVREVSTTVTTRHGNTIFDLLKAASESGAVVELALSNGFAPDNADARGNYGGYVITQWNEEEPVQGFAAASVTFKPSVEGPAIAALPIPGG